MKSSGHSLLFQTRLNNINKSPIKRNYFKLAEVPWVAMAFCADVQAPRIKWRVLWVGTDIILVVSPVGQWGRAALRL